MRGAGADDRLRTIFEENVSFVWRSLRCLGAPERDVEDLCQEVFTVVHRRIGDFEGRSSLRSWLYSICVRTVANHRRLARTRHEVLVGAPPENTDAVAAPQEERLAQLAALTELAQLLDRLDPDQRAVFVLFEVEEVPMKEVATTLGCPLQTAYSRLHAARRSLAAALGESTPARRHA